MSRDVTNIAAAMTRRCVSKGLAVAGPVAFTVLLLGFTLIGCETSPTDPLCTGYETRAESIPADAVKQTPETDLYPVVVSSAERPLLVR